MPIRAHVIESNVRDIRERIAHVASRRARRLLELILEHGAVTTEELAARYGYEHPPRAKRDETDLGFPVVTRKTGSKDGSRIVAEYSLDLLAGWTEPHFK